MIDIEFVKKYIFTTRGRWVQAAQIIANNLKTPEDIHLYFAVAIKKLRTVRTFAEIRELNSILDDPFAQANSFAQAPSVDIWGIFERNNEYTAPYLKALAQKLIELLSNPAIELPEPRELKYGVSLYRFGIDLEKEQIEYKEKEKVKIVFGLFKKKEKIQEKIAVKVLKTRQELIAELSKFA